jgi:signal transduction histidine kinase
MAALHEILSARRSEVIETWRGIVEGEIVPEGLARAELVDHLPRFLAEVIAALRSADGLPTSVPAPDETQTAAGHGLQRLRLGFSLDAVVREYGALRDAIVVTARAAQITPSFEETQCLFEATITGIADAVSEYTRQRDAELQRQHNEHVAFLAHELRNPLASATMALELLKGHLPPELKATYALQRGVSRMQELIDHALQVARTASGVTLRPEPTRLSTLLADAELAASAEAEAHGISLRVEVEADVELAVDVRLITSALNNLVRNAVTYSHRGGLVEVRGRGCAERVTIEVEDACGGLAEGMVEAAFAPFMRLDRAEPGFGLGLAIAKQAVDAHGGSIRVQNLPGCGCIFVLEIPVALAS